MPHDLVMILGVADLKQLLSPLRQNWGTLIVNVSERERLYYTSERNLSIIYSLIGREETITWRARHRAQQGLFAR